MTWTFVRRAGIAAVGIFFLLFGWMAAVAAPDWILNRICGILMERSVQVRWLKPEYEQDLRGIVREGRLNAFYDVDVGMFQDDVRPHTVTRESEWSGAFVGFDAVCSDADNFRKITQMMAIATMIPSAAYGIMPGLKKAIYQADLLEIGELLAEWANHRKQSPAAQHSAGRLLEQIRSLVRKLELTESDLKSIPSYTITDFQRRYFPELSVIRRLNLPEMTVHEEASSSRLRAAVYLLADTPENGCITFVQDKKNASGSDRALLILTEYLGVIRRDGSWQYIPVPKTIRSEKVWLKNGRLLSTDFSLLYLDRSSSRKPVYKEAGDSLGGVPFSDLPNAHNPYRTSLSVSCMLCHGGITRIYSYPGGLEPNEQEYLDKRKGLRRGPYDYSLMKIEEGPLKYHD